MKKILGLLTIGLLLASCGQTSQRNDNHQSSNKVSQPADILFDAAHGVTAGEADWVINGAFSTFNEDINQLGLTTTSTGYHDELTLDTLKHYKALIMPEPNIPLKQKEQQAIKDYVKSGGSVMMIADHYNADRNLNRFDASEIFNGYRRGAFNDITKGMRHDEIASHRMKGVTSSDYLSDTFGVRFRYNALDDVVLNTNDEDNAFGLLDGVKQINMHAGSTILITNPEIAHGIVYPERLDASDRWNHAVDEGVYTTGYKDEGAFIAVSKLGKGKAVFIGDSSIVEDDTPKYVREDNGEKKNTYNGIREKDHQRLLQNLVKWMVKQEDYDNLKGKVTLDPVTPVKSFEVPSQSTEPKREPWGTPGHDYKWYDPATFEEGSFGKSDTKVQSQNNDKEKQDSSLKDTQIKKNVYKISVNYPQSVAPNDYFNIDIDSDKQLKQVAIELIDEDGEQVGLFDGKPPGQSRYFDMKRKENRFHCYFHGKIAREATEQITIKIYTQNQFIEEKIMKVR
ncbi:DNA-binding protein [Macrococcoides caseolyticum]|uniref:DNA-binding protein n=1 Tax=Macrococcoides caseolyticum TaxID=69966 RepID=UPI001F33BE04|nr:DNA-binding protein [Macrococcus caseolyticus]MCE4955917.1 DNA-binding protein [Macrococcus caseolyticus]